MLTNEKAQFKVALGRYVNTHFFEPVDQFLIFKSDLQSHCVLYIMDLLSEVNT